MLHETLCCLARGLGSAAHIGAAVEMNASSVPRCGTVLPDPAYFNETQARRMRRIGDDVILAGYFLHIGLRAAMAAADIRWKSPQL
jgi:hypothetical protein